MMRFQRKTGFIVLLVIVLLVITGFFFLQPSHPDALWKIVSQQCVPHQQQRQNPSPCAEVNLAQRFVVFKDRNGPLQYLLMPTAKVTGIESPLLLNPQQPNYFAAAWQQRDWLSKRYGKPVPDDLLSICRALNPRYLRGLHLWRPHYHHNGSRYRLGSITTATGRERSTETLWEKTARSFC